MAKGWLVDEHKGVWLPEVLDVSAHSVIVFRQLCDLLEKEFGSTWVQQEGKKKASAGLAQAMREQAQALRSWCDLVTTGSEQSDSYGIEKSKMHYHNAKSLLKLVPEVRIDKKGLVYTLSEHPDTRFSLDISWLTPPTSSHNKHKGERLSFLVKMASEYLSSGLLEKRLEAVARDLEEDLKRKENVGKGFLYGTRGERQKFFWQRESINKLGKDVLEQWTKMLGWESTGVHCKVYRHHYLVQSALQKVIKSVRDEHDLLRALKEHEKTLQIVRDPMVDWKRLDALVKVLKQHNPLPDPMDFNNIEQCMRTHKAALLLEEAGHLLGQWRRKIKIEERPHLTLEGQQQELSVSNSFAIYLKEGYGTQREGFWTGSSLSTNVNAARLFATLKEAKGYAQKKFGSYTSRAFIECTVAPKSIESVQGQMDISGLQEVISDQERKSLDQSMQGAQESRKMESTQKLLEHWMQKCMQYERALKDAGVSLPKQEPSAMEPQAPSVRPRFL